MGTQNFLGCFSKSRCLQEVCVTSNGYTVLTGQKMSIQLHYTGSCHYTSSIIFQYSYGYLQHLYYCQLISCCHSLVIKQSGVSEPFALPMVRIPLNFQITRSGPLFPDAHKAPRNYSFLEEKPPDNILYWICSDFWKHLFHCRSAQDDLYQKNHISLLCVKIVTRYLCLQL